MQRIEALTDAEIGEAHDSAKLWQDVEFQVGPFDSFVSFIHALDWLDLKGPDKALVTLWLDGRFGDPLPIARGKKAPEEGKAKPDELERFTAIWQAARELINEERFLNWQVTFPGVWSNWSSKGREGGFDAVVGNPPWDMMEFEEVPWFEARDKAIATEPNRAARRKRLDALKSSGAQLWQDYEKAKTRAAQTTKIARSKLIYKVLNAGRINLFKLFVERAHSLVKPGGMVGLLTPSGIASDLSASAFFRKVATGGHLKALYDFENRRSRHKLEPFFPDVDSRFKFVAMIGSPSRTFPAAQCGFFLQSVDERNNPEQAFPITAQAFARVNPNTGTAPIFRTRRDMALTTAMYERCPVLINKSGIETLASWDVIYNQMLNMSIDSPRFRTKLELEEKEGAWRIGSNRWQSAAGSWIPFTKAKWCKPSIIVRRMLRTMKALVVTSGSIALLTKPHMRM